MVRLCHQKQTQTKRYGFRPVDGARKAVDRHDIPTAWVTVDNPYDKTFLTSDKSTGEMS